MHTPQERIFNFLAGNPLGIVSTIHVDRQAPESAVVAFAQTKDLELVFGTSATTRKYRNLQKNPNVAFVIGWSSATGTLQYEGMARELAAEERAAYSQILIQKNPGSKQFAQLPDQRYFLVRPAWIRFSDNASVPPEVIELQF